MSLAETEHVDTCLRAFSEMVEVRRFLTGSWSLIRLTLWRGTPTVEFSLSFDRDIGQGQDSVHQVQQWCTKVLLSSDNIDVRGDGGWKQQV